MPPEATSQSFAGRLLRWWPAHGRHSLPWQSDRTAYRVWVAEIMLQQTQVGTVIPYFERFMAAFPDLESLADADIDQVLAQWSGLGYYARGRNLHAAARRCMDEHGGDLPASAEALEDLPGIGTSTANAIVAQAHDRRAVILDGNVKRVLARHAGIEGWPGRAAILRTLWREAEERTPDTRAADYTQAIMDLGATVCTPREPACENCPVRRDCRARRTGRTSELPTRKPRKGKKPRRETTMLIIENAQGEYLLMRRPPSGIWGGLWSLPEKGDLKETTATPSPGAPGAIRHEFTHFSLDIRFERFRVSNDSGIADNPDVRWMRPEDALASGLPRPIRRVFQDIDSR